VLAQHAPAVSAKGTFDALEVDATFRASEPGVDVDGKVHLDIPEEKVSFDVNARSKDLQVLARAPGAVSGSGTAHGNGTLDLARGTIAARVTADGSGIARAPASATGVHAEATMSGPVANPIIDVTATAKDVRLTAEADGSNGEKKAPLVYRGATARTRIVLTPTPRLLGTEVHVEGAEGGAAASATAREIVLGPGGVDLRGGRVTGLGGPLDLEVQVQNGALSLRAKGTDVDVRRVSAMTGIEQLKMLPPESRATMDIDIRASANRTDGHFDVSVAGAKDGTAAEVHAKLEGRHVTGNARLQVGALGWVEVQHAEMELPGPLGVSTLERATGALDLRGEIDLSHGAALFGGESIEKISGIAILSARVERGDARNLPTVYASVRTRGLDVTLNRDGTSTHIGDIDGALHVGYDGATDETETSLLAWDASGIVASADAKARVPLVGWATRARAFDRAAVGGLEIAGVLDVPRRDVANLPGIFARPDLVGGVSLHAVLGGSVAHPDAHLVARGEGMSEKQTNRAQARFAPIDGMIEARWDGKDVIATLQIDESERAERAPKADAAPAPSRAKPRKTGHVRGLVLGRVPAADLLAGRALGWNASAELDVVDLELAPLPLPMNMRGALTGRVKLRDLTGSPLLEARAHVDDLGLGGVRVLRGDFKVDAKNGSLDASARVNQDDGGNGRVTVVSSALEWHGLDVGWNNERPTKLDYALDRVRLSLARPFVRRLIPEIDGVVDGRGSATIDAKNQVFEGGITLSGGRLYVNAIGEEITDVSAIAHFERDGAFRIQDATAKIGAGEVKASAAGRFRGLRFESADVVAVVPSKDGVPLSAEGATFADATGEVKLSVRVAKDSKALLVTATVPRAKITVPDRNTQQLQSLDPDETITVGIRQQDDSLAPAVERPGAATRTASAKRAAAAAAANGAPEPAEELLARFTVALGNDVALEGRGVRLVLGGRTMIDLADEIAVNGQITLRQGGTIDVQGRKFVVDHGTVTFLPSDNPSDPIVIAAAYWDAPDRTRIWVEFSGPLKTGKLTLRSEPAFSKNEILSILLFGRPDPNQAKAGDAKSSDAQAATNAGAGALASGLNRALSDLDEDFELEQDTTSANRTRTKLGYRLRRNLKVQLGYASGFSQREPDTTYLFLEWQFIPQWSLVGTRGDRGTSILDLLFQHRY
jgi:translocation and assembly module TamB